jgi:hypothetical protein
VTSPQAPAAHVDDGAPVYPVAHVAVQLAPLVVPPLAQFQTPLDGLAPLFGVLVQPAWQERGDPLRLWIRMVASPQKVANATEPSHLHPPTTQ